jgi:excisionase family DNA binding protein
MDGEREHAGVVKLDEAARYLAVSTVTVRRLVASGELPVARYAGKMTFRVDDLEGFIDAHTVEA